MYQCGKQKKDHVLGHERFWEPAPTESVVHIVKDAFLAAAQIVEFNNIPCRRMVVVGQDTAVSLFAFPQIEFAICTPLPLNDKTVTPAIPFLDENGVEFEPDAVDLLRPPSPKSEDVIIERAASVCADVEVFAMSLYLTDDFLRAGTAVGPEAIYAYVLGFQRGAESLMGVCLMKAHVGVAVAILDIDNLVTDDIHAGSVAEELLVCRFCIILLCLKKLMVEVNVVFLHFLQFASRIPPKGMSFSDFICIFAMSVRIFIFFVLNH